MYKRQEQILAGISYLWFGCLFGLKLGKESDFVQYHARLGFKIAIFETVWVMVWLGLKWAVLISSSWHLLDLIVSLASLVVLALCCYWIIMGIFNVVMYQKKPLFLLGAKEKQ